MATCMSVVCNYRTDLHVYDFYNQHNSQHKVMIVYVGMLYIYIHIQIELEENIHL